MKEKLFNLQNGEERDVARFTKKNNLVEEFIDDVPELINGDGTFYYGYGDTRNTYNPSAKNFYEDFDGSTIEAGVIKEVYDEVDEMNIAELERIQALQESENKTFNYVSYLNMKKPKNETDGN